MQERIATIEGGVGAVCCSSGHAAQLMALFPIMAPGKNIVASTRLYGGTVTQFSQTIKRFGWSATFVDFDDLDAVKAAINEDTQAIFCEAIANPGGYITDLDAVAAVADDAGLPLIVDNTTATPYLCRPIEHGATLVVHSTTKYMTGNGTVTGGCVVDSGKFDWSASGRYPSWLIQSPPITGCASMKHLAHWPYLPFHCDWSARFGHDNEPTRGALHIDGFGNAIVADGTPCSKRNAHRNMA